MEYRAVITVSAILQLGGSTLFTDALPCSAWERIREDPRSAFRFIAKGDFKMKTRSIYSLTLAVFVSISVWGCGLGPRMIKPERMKYSIALQVSANEEMLLNLVRKRYSEMPVFMRITTLTSSMSWSAAAGGSATIPEKSKANVYGLSLDAAIRESPTITFQPFSGEDFAKRALTEIDSNKIMLLFRTGWDIEKLMKVMIKRMGPLRNEPWAPEEGEKFARLAAIWGRLQRRGDLRITMKPGGTETLGAPLKKAAIDIHAMIAADKGGYSIVCDDQESCRLVKSSGSVMTLQAQYRDEEEAKEVESILNISPEMKIKTPEGHVLEEILLVNRYDLADRLPKVNRGHVSILMRSLNGILSYLSAGVKIPPEDKIYADSANHEDGESVNWSEHIRDILVVNVTDSKPRGAYIKVFYRGKWFSISDSDENSKETLLLLHLLFDLQSGAPGGSVPILTLPVGG